MTPAEEAVFWLATVKYLLYCDRIDRLTDMGPMTKSMSYEDARWRWDLSRTPWKKALCSS